MIPDITIPGAYDEVVKDVDAIIHSDHPWCSLGRTLRRSLTLPSRVPLAFYLAAKFGKNVQRVILTSSAVAVGTGDQKKGEVYDEASKRGIHILYFF